MSSIYKKGRDGYYYYQTYIYNPESKKKDKRVFHALGTKSSVEAKTKQKELDLRYERQNYTDSNPSNSSYNFGPAQTIAIIIGTIAFTIILNNYFSLDDTKQNEKNLMPTEKQEITKKKYDSISEAVQPVKKNVIDAQVNPSIENIPEILKANPDPKPVEPKITLPKYTVERVDVLSSAFDQGKVYVTINENTSNESQRLLCKDLARRYNEFSNIVICLYANNRAGKDLANGNNETVSIEEQKRFWLGMYTYNSVEGEYFDDNPSGYLGIY